MVNKNLIFSIVMLAITTLVIYYIIIPPPSIEYTINISEVGELDYPIQIKYIKEQSGKLSKVLNNGKVRFKLNERPKLGKINIDSSKYSIDHLFFKQQKSPKDTTVFNLVFTAHKKYKTLQFISHLNSSIDINNKNDKKLLTINKGISYYNINRNNFYSFELFANSSNNYHEVDLNNWNNYSGEFDELSDTTIIYCDTYLNTFLRLSLNVKNMQGEFLNNAEISVDGINSNNINLYPSNNKYSLSINPYDLKLIGKKINDSFFINIFQENYSSETISVTIPPDYIENTEIPINISLDRGFTKRFIILSENKPNLKNVKIYKDDILSKILKGNIYIHSYKDSQIKSKNVNFSFRKKGYKNYNYKYVHNNSPLHKEIIKLTPVFAIIKLSQFSNEKSIYKNKGEFFPLEGVKIKGDGLVSQVEISPGKYRLQFEKYNQNYTISLSDNDASSFEKFEENIFLRENMSEISYSLNPKTILDLQILDKQKNIIKGFNVNLDGKKYKSNEYGRIKIEISSKTKSIPYIINNHFYSKDEGTLKIYPGINKKEIIVEPLFLHIELINKNTNSIIPNTNIIINDKNYKSDKFGKIKYKVKKINEKINIKYGGHKYLNNNKSIIFSSNNFNYQFLIEPFPGVNLTTHYEGDVDATIDGVKLFLNGEFIGETSDEGVLNYKLPTKLDNFKIKATKKSFIEINKQFSSTGTSTDINIPLLQILGKIKIQTGSGKPIKNIKISYLGRTSNTKKNGRINIYPEKLNLPIEYLIEDPNGGYVSKKITLTLDENNQEFEITLKPIPTKIELDIRYEWSGVPAKGFIEIKPQPEIGITEYKLTGTSKPLEINFYESNEYQIIINAENKNIFIEDSLSINIIMNGKTTKISHSIGGASIKVCSNDQKVVSVMKIDSQGLYGDKMSVIGDCNTELDLDGGYGLYRFSYIPEGMGGDPHIEQLTVSMPRQLINLKIEDKYINCLTEKNNSNYEKAIEYCLSISESQSSYCKSQITLEELYLETEQFLESYLLKSNFISKGNCTFNVIDYVDLLSIFNKFNDNQWEYFYSDNSAYSKLEELLVKIDQDIQAFNALKIFLPSKMKKSQLKKIKNNMMFGIINGLKHSSKKNNTLNDAESNKSKDINSLLADNFEQLLFHCDNSEKNNYSNMANKHIIP